MRVPPWVVSDGLWERIEPLLPRRERRFRYPGRKPLDDRVVLQGVNPRESLEDAIFDINKELAKKQEEFGLPVDRSMYRRG